MLQELRDHIKGLVSGKHTLEQFAEFYCIKIEPAAEPEKKDGPPCATT